MFALFGEIEFELADSPTAIRSSRTYDYAAHKVVQATPRVEWLSDGLERISLEMMFHVAFTNPYAQMAALLLAADDHLARPLVLGNGIHRGYFVVTKVSAAPRQSLADGTAVALNAQVHLMEWPLAQLLDPSAAPRPAALPIALIPSATLAIGASPGAAVNAAASTASAPVTAALPSQLKGVSALATNTPSAAAPAASRLAGDMPTGAITRSGES